MAGSLREKMNRYVSFSEIDADLLRKLAPRVRPRLGEVVERFYGALAQDPGARAVLGDDPERQAGLLKTLHQWLVELFSGQYDDAYYERRARIGRAHVRVGMPQHYMLTSMSVVRTALTRIIREEAPPDAEPALESLHKLLDLDLAVMLDTYREDLIAKMRQAERESMQARLDESKHMASIGQLAAALAHEIKNPLAGISGAIQIILESCAPDDPNREVLDEVLAQIDRLDLAVNDALIYSRPKPPERRRHRVGELIQHVLCLLQEEPALRKVRLEAVGLDDGVFASIDEAQLQQVVSNLLLNAAHASTDGGVIRLSVTDDSDSVCIKVTDFGHGMPPQVRAHAFEPFYTTKAKGTGLGLPICKHIVDAHGGRITIESEQGVGTTVVVELPKEAKAVATDNSVLYEDW